MEETKLSPRSRDFYNGFDGFKAHVPICLLRQICQKISKIDPVLSSMDSADEKEKTQSKSIQIQRFYGALMFVDISGFTKLSTKLDVESLKTHINNYFKDMLDIVDSYGGDVAKFAGDAMYVVWHAKSYSEREVVVLKAVACAKEIIIKCNNRDLSLSRTISLNSRNSFMRMSLTQSIIFAESTASIAQGNGFDSSHDNAVSEFDLAKALQLGPISLRNLADDVEPFTRRSSTSSIISKKVIKKKLRSFSLRSATPYTLNTIFNNNDQGMEPGQMSLNVHIGISTGVMAGVDVGAEERSEFFLTGQPLLDVAAAESLSTLGEIVVSKSVFNFLIKHDASTNYECVGGELGCHRIIGPLTLSIAEINFKIGAVAELKKELNFLLSTCMASKSYKETNLNCILLKCLGTHVHEAVRMLSHNSVSQKEISLPSISQSPSLIFPLSSATATPLSINSSFNIRSISEHSTGHDSNDIDGGRDYADDVQHEIVIGSIFENINSIGNQGYSDKCIEPDDSLSAELRELVVLFIKIDVDVTLFHNKSSDMSDENQCDKAFKTDCFGFIERSEEDVTADVDLHERLEVCMRILVETFAQRGGQIGQYSCGDKGNVCLGTFGLRGSVQQDNAAAAVECAQTIIVRLQAMNLNASIGVTSGKLYSGLLGSPKRHEYSIMGPAANLAARLMSAAAPGSVLCCKETRNRDRSHIFLSMPEVIAKGFSEPVTTYQPVLSATSKMIRTKTMPSLCSFDDLTKVNASSKAKKIEKETIMYGQSCDMGVIMEFFQDSFPSLEPQEGLKIAVITGTCGSGKSTFLAAVRDEMSKIPTFKAGVSNTEFIFSGVSNMFDSTSPFSSWRPILVDLIAAVSRAAFPLGSKMEEKTYSRRSSISSQAVFSPGKGPSLGKSRMSSRRTSLSGSGTTRENSPASNFQSPKSYSHLKAGTTLIIDALPPDMLPLLHLVFEILPSFAKGALPSVVESTFSGPTKLVKTVEILSVIIQTAVKQLSPLIFITLDDVHSMDSSSWSLLTYMWKHNKNIIILASCISLSCTQFSGKKVKAGVSVVDFEDFKDPQRCKIIALKPLQRKAMSQQVSNLLLSSRLDDSQIAIITEATIKLAGGNPLFAREITISAVDLLKDFITPQTGSTRSQKTVADATLSHVINSLHPHHRIEEIISLRFDRLSATHQLVLKVASVIGKDGACFTADAISHVIIKLSTTTVNVRSKMSRLQREQSANIDVEDVLDEILNLNDFIKVKTETMCSRSIAMNENDNKKAVKYKFKNVLIENSIYDIMLNHQKIWSHEKVAEYFEAKALSRVEELASGVFEYDSDSENDGGSAGTSRGAWSESRMTSYSDQDRSLASISEWNTLGVHWRLSNNLIKAMACFYESGYLVDAQGDVEGAKFLWCEAYEIFCLMSEEAGLSKNNRSVESASAIDFNPNPNHVKSVSPLITARKRISSNKNNVVKLLPSGDEESLLKGFGFLNSSESIYQVFKGDSLALEVAVTLMIKLSQNVAMFENNPDDVAALGCEALNLVTLTSKELLEEQSSQFIHVSRLSTILYLKDSSLLGVEGKEEMKPAVSSGIFCLRDPCIIFPALSGLCMKYAGKTLNDDEHNSKWEGFCDRFITTSKQSQIDLHIMRAQANQSFMYWSSKRFSAAVDLIDEVDKTYNFQSHSERLIHTYGSDWVLIGYAVAAVCCVMMGDFQKALKYYRRVNEDLKKVIHIQTKIVAAFFNFMCALQMQAYSVAHIDLSECLNSILLNGGEDNIFREVSHLLAEQGRCLAAINSNVLEESFIPPFGNSSSIESPRSSHRPSDNFRRPSNASRRLSYVSDGSISILSDESVQNVFDYTQIIFDSEHLDAIAVNKKSIAILLALRYGKGEEVWKAELCLLEARRLQAILTSLSDTPARINKKPLFQKSSVTKKLTSIMKPFSGIFTSFWNKTDRLVSNENNRDSSVDIEAKVEKMQDETKMYCLAGLRFLDFSLATYPIYDSMVNRLLCFVVKAELLVVLAGVVVDSNDPFISSELILAAKDCLQSALDLHLPCVFELPLLLTGLRYVQLGLNVKKGKELLTVFLLSIVNRDKAPNEVILDVHTVINDRTKNYEWMKDIPVLSTVIMLIRDF